MQQEMLLTPGSQANRTCTMQAMTVQRAGATWFSFRMAKSGLQEENTDNATNTTTSLKPCLVCP